MYLRAADEFVAPPTMRVQVEQQVTNLNRHFQRAGLQFFVRSFRHVSAPKLSAIPFDAEMDVPWIPPAGPSIRDEIAAIVGANPWPGRPASDDMLPSDWLNLSLLKYGREDTLYLMLGRDSTASYGAHRWRYLYLNAGDFSVTPLNSTVAHEMGHVFRLSHPYEGALAGATNPVTGLASTPSQYWDLAYCPGDSVGNPHQYFGSFADAEAGCSPGKSPARMVFNLGASNCTATTCTLPGGAGYSETLGVASWQLRRGATFLAADGTTGWNIMTGRPAEPAMGFSPSQLATIRNSLRYDYRVPGGDTYLGLPNAPYTGKPKLGAASTGQMPLASLDVNGDGARDLVVFTVAPGDSYAVNSARFTVAFAPTFTTQQTSYFGRPGDIPVMADFNGDGFTDHGVYRPDEAGTGTTLGQGIWYWCLSSAAGLGNCATGGYQSRSFGASGDVPLPGLRLGATPRLAVYRPDTSTVFWGPASNPYPYSQLQLDTATPSAGHDLLLDDYDGDGLTDWGLKRSSDGLVKVALSTSAWAPAATKSFTFPAWASYAVPEPDPGGPMLVDRAGAMAVVGLLRVAPGAGSGTRSSLALWNPSQYRTCIFPDVAGAGASTTVTCANSWGAGLYPWAPLLPDDLRLGGLRNTNAATGAALMGWIRFFSGSPPQLFRMDVALGGTTGLPTRGLFGMRDRGTAAFVADMGLAATHDGLPELLVEGVHAGTWLIFWSHTDYTTSTLVTLGSPGSRML